MIEISLLGKRINHNWALFVSLKSLFRVGVVGIVTIKRCHRCQSLSLSPEPRDITFVQIVQSLRFTTFVILRNPFVIIATTFASDGISSNYKNGHSKRPIDESRSQKSRQNTRFIYSLTAGRHHSNLHNTSHNEVPDLVWCFPTWFYDVFRGNNGDSPMTQHKVVNAGLNG